MSNNNANKRRIKELEKIISNALGMLSKAKPNKGVNNKSVNKPKYYEILGETDIRLWDPTANNNKKYKVVKFSQKTENLGYGRNKLLNEWNHHGWPTNWVGENINKKVNRSKAINILTKHGWVKK